MAGLLEPYRVDESEAVPKIVPALDHKPVSIMRSFPSDCKGQLYSRTPMVSFPPISVNKNNSQHRPEKIRN